MKISVIIPTRNEEANIARLIESLRSASDRETTEIIVVDAQSSDRTADIAQGLADRVIRTVHPGRGSQMHKGALSASGDLLLFLHADTELPLSWQGILNKAWTSGAPRSQGSGGQQTHQRRVPLLEKPVATAFRLNFDNEGPFFRFLQAAANWRTSWTRIPHGDQAIAIDREIYFRSGGFPAVPIMEEYFLFKKLRRFGCVRILPEAIKTSTRRYEQNGRIFNAIRNTLIIALFYAGVPTSFLARLYDQVTRSPTGTLRPARRVDAEMVEAEGGNHR